MFDAVKNYKSWLLSLPDNHRFAMLASHIARFRTQHSDFDSDFASIIFQLKNKGVMSDFLLEEIFKSVDEHKKYTEEQSKQSETVQDVEKTFTLGDK